MAIMQFGTEKLISTRDVRDLGEMKSFRVIPVIDIKRGVAVHGVQGRREEYMPVKSSLTSSSNVLDLAKAFREALGLSDLYVADLDAIVQRRPQWEILEHLKDIVSGEMWVDVGIRNQEDIVAELSLIPFLVLGTETLESLATLESITDSLGSEKLIVSLDLLHGKILGSESLLKEVREPYDIIGFCRKIGIHRVIVLDLHLVGSGLGPELSLLREAVRASGGQIEIYWGGGVRSVEDINQLGGMGLAGCLTASALHQGRITKADIGAMEAAQSSSTAK